MTNIENIILLGNQSPEWQTPIMTKILAMTKSQYLSFESIYIIDISIYLDLPARETDRQIYRLSIERIISINISINIYSCQPIVPLPSPPLLISVIKLNIVNYHKYYHQICSKNLYDRLPTLSAWSTLPASLLIRFKSTKHLLASTQHNTT